jgi:hypothetical protein
MVMDKRLVISEIEAIKAHKDSGHILVAQVAKIREEYITGLVQDISTQIKIDYEHKTKASQVFDGEPTSLIAEPFIKDGLVLSETATYLMSFPNDEEQSETHPKGYCPRMHVHPLGERNVIFFVGDNTKLLLQSLSPIILEGGISATLSEDFFPGTERKRYHAVLIPGLYLVRLAANTSHNFVSLGNSVATISLHPNEYAELRQLDTSSQQAKTTLSSMQEQTVFLQDNAGILEDCYPK